MMKRDFIVNIIKNDSIKQEIRINIFIVSILSIIFYTCLCVFGRYGLSNILGIMLGSSYSVLNFIFISISMERLVLISKQRVKFIAVVHYVIRYLLIGMVIAIVMKMHDKIDVFSFLVTLFFSKLAIFVQAFLSSKRS